MRSLKVIASVVLAILITGCAAKSQFVLLPDPDGRTGKMEVRTAAGVQVVDKPWQATDVSRTAGLPGQPKQLEEKEVRRIFQEALAAQPSAPVSFLIYFQKNSTKLTAGSVGVIPGVMEAIKSRDSRSISVIGHTDAVGEAGYNRRLSLSRAKAVADFLVSRGINRDLLDIEYYGESKPLIKTPDEVPEPRNRRVEIIIK